MPHTKKPVLSDWHRQIAAGIAAAHPITPAVPIRAVGNHLASQNDEPDEAALIAADRQYSIGKAERFHCLNDRRALEIQVREQDCGVVR